MHHRGGWMDLRVEFRLTKQNIIDSVATCCLASTHKWCPLLTQLLIWSHCTEIRPSFPSAGYNPCEWGELHKTDQIDDLICLSKINTICMENDVLPATKIKIAPLMINNLLGVVLAPLLTSNNLLGVILALLLMCNNLFSSTCSAPYE